MNLSIEKKLMDMEKRLGVAKGAGVGQNGNLEIIDVQY